MLGQESLLVTLVRLVDRLPVPPPPPQRGRGRPQVYADRLFLKALVLMIVRHLHTVHELLTVLDQPTPEMLLLREWPAEVRYVLGDRHYNTPELRQACAAEERELVTTRYGRYPHTDAGVDVRRIFHTLRSLAIENFDEQFKGIFDGHGHVPTRGLSNTRRFALGAVFVYQLTLWYRFEHDMDLRGGLKPFLKAA